MRKQAFARPVFDRRQRQLSAMDLRLGPGPRRKIANLTGPGVDAVVSTQVPFAFELMHYSGHVTGLLSG